MPWGDTYWFRNSETGKFEYSGMNQDMSKGIEISVDGRGKIGHGRIFLEKTTRLGKNLQAFLFEILLPRVAYADDTETINGHLDASFYVPVDINDRFEPNGIKLTSDNLMRMESFEGGDRWEQLSKGSSEFGNEADVDFEHGSIALLGLGVIGLFGVVRWRLKSA
jgi:hypothetical protein